MGDIGISTHSGSGVRWRGNGVQKFTTHTRVDLHFDAFNGLQIRSWSPSVWGRYNYGYNYNIGQHYPFFGQELIVDTPLFRVVRPVPLIIPIIAAPQQVLGATVTPNPTVTAAQTAAPPPPAALIGGQQPAQAAVPPQSVAAVQGPQPAPADFWSAVYIQEIGKVINTNQPFGHMRLGNDFQIYSMDDKGEPALFVGSVNQKMPVGTGKGALIELRNRLSVNSAATVAQQLQTPQGLQSFMAATQAINAQIYPPGLMPAQPPLPTPAPPPPAILTRPAGPTASAAPTPTERATPIIPVQVAPASVPMNKEQHKDFEDRTSKVKNGATNFDGREIRNGNVTFVVTPVDAHGEGGKETKYSVSKKVTKGDQVAYADQTLFSKNEYDLISKKLETDQDALSKAMVAKRTYGDLKMLASMDVPQPYVTDPNAALTQAISIPSTGAPAEAPGAAKNENVADASIKITRHRTTTFGLNG